MRFTTVCLTIAILVTVFSLSEVEGRSAGVEQDIKHIIEGNVDAAMEKSPNHFYSGDQSQMNYASLGHSKLDRLRTSRNG